MSPRLAKSSTSRSRRRRATGRWEREKEEALRRRWKRPALHLFSTVDSTNDVAKDLAEQDAPAGALILADEQKAGRGRGGRRWASPKGAGLYFTLVLRPQGSANLTLIPILAGLAVVRALDRIVPGAHPAIKWPNDILLNDRKCGGVLAEAAWDGPRPRYVVLGVGLNVRTRPKDLPKELRDVATSVEAETAEKPSRLLLMDEIVEELDRLLVKPGDSLGTELLRDLDAYDWLRDRRCVVLEPDKEREVSGVATGIAPDGALLFRPDSGPLRRIVSGRVSAPELRLPEI